MSDLENSIIKNNVSNNKNEEQENEVRECTEKEEQENKVRENEEKEEQKNEVRENAEKEEQENEVGQNTEKESENKENKVQESEEIDTNKSGTNTDQLKPVRENYVFLLLLALGFGFLFMFCFYDFYINFNGILYPLFVVSLFGFSFITLKVLNRTIKKNTYFYAIAAVLLGISSFLTMNWFIVIFNTLGIIILFTIFLFKQFYEDSDWGILHYFKNIVIVWLEAIASIRYLFKHGISLLKPLKHEKSKWLPILKGIIYGGIFLGIVLPLLASADMVFQKLMKSIFSIFKNPFSGELNYYLFLVIIAMFMFYGLICSFASNGLNDKVKVIKKKEATSAIVMAGIITATYLLFCGIQIVYLFGGNFLTLPEGITYAKYAQQGFFQLLFVVMINIGMVVLCVKKYSEHNGLKRLLTIISICTFIMIASAMYRMILYISVYHLTFLRVLVIWFLITLTVLMIGVLYYIYHNTYKIDKFFFRTVLFCYFILAFMRPDYIIANYNINHIEKIQSEDVRYLVSDLSFDAIPALAKIDENKLDLSEKMIYGSDYVDLETYINEYYGYAYRMYDGKIRSFNVSRYFAYQTAREHINSSLK
ncbi:DUF4153 domain-containing protein [Clostridium sp. Marseille-P299]|uniref:DUF4153 domain-containing protein n=1 Tax=Clostridium sp. Marseille-P299 TaxID=1805477 RepID=UPI0008336AA0|nr:DUF4173 domain-containing protein [Clostridium sp. Marseille-P299]